MDNKRGHIKAILEANGAQYQAGVHSRWPPVTRTYETFCFV